MGKKNSVYRDTYKPNDTKTVCDATGFVCHLSDTVRQWDGKRVIKEFAEPRHPQDTPVIPRAPRVYMDARTQDEQEIRVYTPPEDLSQL